jgi:hypothetical protein
VKYSYDGFRIICPGFYDGYGRSKDHVENKSILDHTDIVPFSAVLLFLFALTSASDSYRNAVVSMAYGSKSFILCLYPIHGQTAVLQLSVHIMRVHLPCRWKRCTFSRADHTPIFGRESKDETRTAKNEKRL